MQFPISIELHRSKLLIALLVAGHGAAAAGIGVLPWPLLWRGLLLALLGLSLVASLRPSDIVGLHLAARDRLECLLADGRRIPAHVLSDSTVYSWMIVLRLRLSVDKRPRALVVLIDQTQRDELRCLRLWLRWQGETTDDAADDA